jgi:hypothetical protein
MERHKRGQINCHLSEKAEEEQKETKAAAALFNVQTVALRCQETKQKGIPAGYHLLNHN